MKSKTLSHNKHCVPSSTKEKATKNYLRPHPEKREQKPTAKQDEESHPYPKRSRDSPERTPARKRPTASRKNSPIEKNSF